MKCEPLNCSCKKNIDSNTKFRVAVIAFLVGCNILGILNLIF